MLHSIHFVDAPNLVRFPEPCNATDTAWFSFVWTLALHYAGEVLRPVMCDPRYVT